MPPPIELALDAANHLPRATVCLVKPHVGPSLAQPVYERATPGDVGLTVANEELPFV